MSLLWNKNMFLHIGADAVHATLPPDRKGISVTQTVPVNEATNMADTLTALLAEILPKAGKSRPSLTATISLDLVHLDIAAGNFASYSEQQLEAIATGCMSELLGEGATPMEVRWQLQPNLQHILLCALDSHLVQAVIQTAQAHQLELASLQPVFCHYWNKYSKSMRRSKGIFALQDSQRALVCLNDKGSVTALSCGPAARSDLDQPSNGRAKSPLDLRVDRLLTSTGGHADAIDQYLLVTHRARDLAPHPRWTVIDIPERRL